jgi:hypothetical protein
MNNITNTNTNTNNIISNIKDSPIFGDKTEFCNKIDKLNTSLKDENNNQKYNKNELTLESANYIKKLVNDKEQEQNKEDQVPINNSLTSSQPTISIGANCNVEIQNRNITQVIHSLQEISSLIDKFCLSQISKSQTTQSVLDISYLDNNGTNIEFKLQKEIDNQFHLTCTINTKIIKNYITELNDRLTKKGWSIVNDHSNASYKIIKTSQY